MIGNKMFYSLMDIFTIDDPRSVDMDYLNAQHDANL